MARQAMRNVICVMGICEQSVAGIRELTVGIKKEEVAGISFGGQMHGLVILDENEGDSPGNPLE